MDGPNDRKCTAIYQTRWSKKLKVDGPEMRIQSVQSSRWPVLDQSGRAERPKVDGVKMNRFMAPRLET